MKEDIKNKKNTPSYSEATGKRKESIARVRLTPAKHTDWDIDGRDLISYFNTPELRQVATLPLACTPDTPFTIEVHVRGGGIHAQAEAVALGIARASIINDAGIRPTLKKARLLTRDARIKERRKFGLKKARKAPQWSKR